MLGQNYSSLSRKYQRYRLLFVNIRHHGNEQCLFWRHKLDHNIEVILLLYSVSQNENQWKITYLGKTAVNKI